MPVLAVGDGEQQRRVKLPPRADAFVVGSDASCDLRVEGAAVDGRHLRLTRRDRRWRLLERGPAWINGEAQEGEHALRDGDVVRLGSAVGAPVLFSDATAWLRGVAPWATHATPERTRELGTGVVRVAAGDHDWPVAIAFDLGEAGLAARWDDAVVAVVAERPPGPERVVVERAPRHRLDVEGLRALLRVRIADATEAALRPVDTSSWLHAERFGWLPLGGEQRVAVSWRWERGLYSSTAVVPAPEGALLVTATTPDEDPSRNARLQSLLVTLALGEEPRPAGAHEPQIGRDWVDWPEPPPTPEWSAPPPTLPPVRPPERTMLGMVGASLAAEGLKSYERDGIYFFTGREGGLVLRACRKLGDPATTLNRALSRDPRVSARGILGRGRDASENNPKLYGVPCRLHGGRVQHAIVTRIGRELTCFGLAFRRDRGVVVEVRNVRHRFGVCVAIDPAVGEALRSLEWMTSPLDP